MLAQADPMIAEFERWVRAHLCEPLSISDAARALGLSERQLQRATAATPRRHYGEAPAATLARPLR